MYDLPRFVTADEAKWVYRSAQFLAAFLQGDFAATNVNLTPAVTTTWLGSLGLTGYYWLHQSTLSLPFVDWLRSLPPFSVDLPVLVATRWPMVIFTALSVVAIYGLAHRLFNRGIALLTAIFVALSPHTVALSRILGHDAPAAMFVTIALLLLMLAVHRPPGRASLLPALLSGVTAGLAFLSKAPALFLIPFAGLLLGFRLWRDREWRVYWLILLLLWGVVGYQTFVAVWPAAWVNPIGQSWAVVENAFLSATDQEESEAENYWQVPNLGPLYYVVNGSFKLSPLVLVGAMLAVGLITWRIGIRWQDRYDFETLRARRVIEQFFEAGETGNTLWLLAFVILFVIFMTLGGKRSPRYILPVFPALAIIAAVGWLWCIRIAGNKLARKESASQLIRLILLTVLPLSAAIILLFYLPYGMTYLNPLLGGPMIAPKLIKIGWGEGLDQVGRYLQREHSDSRVGTAYASTLSPYFTGDLTTVTGNRLDYLVLYLKQVQSGDPSPAFIQYFTHQPALFSTNLDGVHYANVYAGPSLQPAVGVAPGATGLQPVSFRPLTPYGHIGEPLAVDVIWQNDESPLAEPINVTLKLTGKESPILAESPAELAQTDTELLLSHHTLSLPSELPRGVYTLAIEGIALGEVELRHFQPPSELGKLTEELVFDRQIALLGYRFEPTEDYIRVTLGWQALKSALPDYIVFVQLLNAGTGERVAGFDTQPGRGEWPTSRWAAGEVVVDDYLVAIPPDLPADNYLIIAGLYHPDTGERLLLNNGEDHWLLPWTFIWK
jgi:4-amino-4-deoxy-L-arabinose transferase-like glycosyltransferase